MDNKKIRKATNFDELLDIKYGKPGTKKRELFEKNANDFLIKELAHAKNKQSTH